MKLVTGSAIAALAMVLAGCGGDEGNTNNQSAAKDVPLQQVAAPNGDWTQVVAETPQGGFVMGNLEAPVKLVEFGSLTCGHCALFAEEGVPPLVEKYVKSGQVSFEFRNFVRDPVDLAAALLSRCNGPAAFFPLTEQLFAAQQEWYGKAAALPQEQLQQIGASSQPAVGYAAAAGLDQFVRVRGVPAAKAQACLADQGQVQRLVQQNTDATKEYSISGTPTFLINGKVAEGGEWKTIEPQIQAALRG